MKKIIGIIIAGIIIMTLFGNGKSRGARENKEIENRTGTESTVTVGQGTESEQESSDDKQKAVSENQTPEGTADEDSLQESEEGAEEEFLQKTEVEEEEFPEEPEEDLTEKAEKENEQSEEESEIEQETEQEEETEDEPNESTDGGISPEFKAAMDSYEEFFDEYVAFMEKYSKSSNPSGMIMDYSAYMMKYADTMKKLDQVDYDKLTVPEQAYYIEVMARIQKKLLESTQ